MLQALLLCEGINWLIDPTSLYSPFSWERKASQNIFFSCPSPEQKLTSDSIQAWQHSRPNQSPNTNRRRMNRNGFKSQFLLLSAQNLLIAFPFLSVSLSLPLPPPLTCSPLPNFVKPLQFPAICRAKRSWTLARRGESVSLMVCVKIWWGGGLFTPGKPQQRVYVGEMGTV